MKLALAVRENKEAVITQPFSCKLPCGVRAPHLMLLESDASREIGGLTTAPDEPVREAAAATAAAAL